MLLNEETHAARWGLMRGFACYCNEVGGLRCDRLNPKGVSPHPEDKGKPVKSQPAIRINLVNRPQPHFRSRATPPDPRSKIAKDRTALRNVKEPGPA